MSSLETSTLTEFETKIIAFFVEAASVLGVPKSVAMIYGVLFGSAAPLTFAEIEQKLGLSKGSVSQGLRVLRDIGAVSVAENGSEDPSRTEGSATNAVRYVPVVELRVLLNRLVIDKVQPHIKTSGEVIDSLAETLPANEASAKVLEVRLKHLRAWQKRARDIIPIFRTFLR